MDYTGNSKKEKSEKVKPEKKIKRVVQGEVLVQKKTIGRKFKDLFIMADFRSVVQYVFSDVLLPAARNMIVDSSTKGIERMMYGPDAMRRRNIGSPPGRVSYTNYSNSNPINRGVRSAPPVQTTSRSVRSSREDFILATREEAELVVERMNDIIETYDVVSVADLNDLVGFPTTHVDNKWGWTFLVGVNIIQTREGYLIDLPPADPIN